MLLDNINITINIEKDIQLMQFYKVISVNITIMSGVPWNSKHFRKFIHQFVCNKCRDERKVHTHLKCAFNCKKLKPWITSKALNYWMIHVKKHHFDENIIIEMLNLKFCNHGECMELIDKSLRFCRNHEDGSEDDEVVISELNNNSSIGSKVKSSKRKFHNSQIINDNIQFDQLDRNRYFRQQNGDIFDLHDLFYSVSLNSKRYSN